MAGGESRAWASLHFQFRCAGLQGQMLMVVEVPSSAQVAAVEAEAVSLASLRPQVWAETFFKMWWKGRALPYLFRRGKLFDLLVKHSLQALALLRYDMFRSVESHTIAEYQSDISNELVCAQITRVGRIGIGFDRIRCHQFAFDGRKIHRVLNDLKIMRYLQGFWIDRKTEWNSILHLFESPDCRERKLVLRCTEG